MEDVVGLDTLPRSVAFRSASEVRHVVDDGGGGVDIW